MLRPYCDAIVLCGRLASKRVRSTCSLVYTLCRAAQPSDEPRAEAAPLALLDARADEHRDGVSRRCTSCVTEPATRERVVRLVVQRSFSRAG